MFEEISNAIQCSLIAEANMRSVRAETLNDVEVEESGEFNEQLCGMLNLSLDELLNVGILEEGRERFDGEIGGRSHGGKRCVYDEGAVWTVCSGRSRV